ncbi:unnamed protein product, partial [Rotaria sp. Silwood2]
LAFNDGNIRGNGDDDVGLFDVTGSYSKYDNHLTLTKQYKCGTGETHDNRGHQVKVDLKWNHQTQRFNGQWAVLKVHPNAELLLSTYPLSQQESNWPLLAVSNRFLKAQ